MRLFKGIGLSILGLIMIYFSLKKRFDKELEKNLTEKLEDESKFYDATVNFKLLLFGIFSLLVGILFLLSELSLIDIYISEFIYPNSLVLHKL